MILRLRPEILEDTLLPEPFHVVPIVNHAVFNGIVERVCPANQYYSGGWGVRDDLTLPGSGSWDRFGMAGQGPVCPPEKSIRNGQAIAGIVDAAGTSPR